ncbi:putative ABC transport system permease protein [Methylovorus glucosotrophus]|uniref:ABC transporter permease n=1 Tax=Methylovorus glucosotrophus TaxID=266009 RepID=UPI0013319C4A|nr:ABC transporter permease [Methylovorus glucosotrophus]KAF0844132.1 putative ABC transport system permease protein [Methylovorus glucosotrophus]
MFSAMLGEAWHAMGANRLRTFLTMLGMVIGVGAVVLMMAIGQGAEQAVKKSIQSMGSNLFIVLAGPPNMGGARSATGNAPSLNVKDAAAMEDLEGVSNVAPINMGSAQVIYAGNNWNTSIIGTTPSYLDVRSWNLSDGYVFSDSDIRSATRVALIGKTVVQNLFGDDDPVGKTIRIKDSPFIILGVLDNKGQSLDGRDQDDTIIIPLTTSQRRVFGAQFSGSVRQIIVQADSDKVMPMVEDSLNSLLRQRHRIREGMDNDFSVRNLTALANSAAETTKTMSLLLGAIASVSLLVGGIGIMNIMLVSVTERTREIGIRMAIGARERDILMQFLLEAIVISIVGCLIGIGIGVGGALLVSHITQAPIVVSSQSILTAFIVAATVGVFFGFYPARKAAQLNPIEALRFQ